MLGRLSLILGVMVTMGQAADHRFLQLQEKLAEDLPERNPHNTLIFTRILPIIQLISRSILLEFCKSFIFRVLRNTSQREG